MDRVTEVLEAWKVSRKNRQVRSGVGLRRYAQIRLSRSKAAQYGKNELS